MCTHLETGSRSVKSEVLFLPSGFLEKTKCLGDRGDRGDRGERGDLGERGERGVVGDFGERIGCSGCVAVRVDAVEIRVVVEDRLEEDEVDRVDTELESDVVVSVVVSVGGNTKWMWFLLGLSSMPGELTDMLWLVVVVVAVVVVVVAADLSTRGSRCLVRLESGREMRNAPYAALSCAATRAHTCAVPSRHRPPHRTPHRGTIHSCFSGCSLQPGINKIKKSKKKKVAKDTIGRANYLSEMRNGISEEEEKNRRIIYN